MPYLDPFWYTFLHDFPQDEIERSEREAKIRLTEAIERHRNSSVRIVVSGELDSH